MQTFFHMCTQYAANLQGQFLHSLCCMYFISKAWFLELVCFITNGNG